MMKLLMLLAVGVLLLVGCKKEGQGTSETTTGTAVTTSTTGTRGIEMPATRGMEETPTTTSTLGTKDETTSKPALDIEHTKDKTRGTMGETGRTMGGSQTR